MFTLTSRTLYLFNETRKKHDVVANDYAKMKTLGEEYTKVESELAGAWSALEAIA